MFNRLPRSLYSAVWWLALPLVFLTLLLRAIRRPSYRSHWLERFGVSKSHPNQGLKPVWIHAVSVGETRAAQPLIQALLSQSSDITILLTHMTPTGRAAGASLYAKFLSEGRLVQAYLPYDYRFAMQRFIRHWQPRLSVMMETEVWPNLIASANELRVPIALVNARLSEKSLKKGLRVERLMVEAVKGFDAIVAQSQDDADRIQRFSPVAKIQVVGNTKFDVQVPIKSVELGQQWKALIDRPTIVFASSRDGEEVMFFQSFREKLQKINRPSKRPLVIIVPRHPERFSEVHALAVKHGFSVARRSQGMHMPITEDILLGDSMGEMFAYYAASNVAIIGGSFGPFGSQNLLEAMAVGCPVIVGPSRFNFDHIIIEAIASGGAIGVQEMAQATDEAFSQLNPNVEKTPNAEKIPISELARRFCDAHQGATKKTLEVLKPLL
jgi:3-deoxy-D-manno-octulosonic-acid transferase